MQELVEIDKYIDVSYISIVIIWLVIPNFHFEIESIYLEIESIYFSLEIESIYFIDIILSEFYTYHHYKKTITYERRLLWN